MSSRILHITNGRSAGEMLAEAGIKGDFLIWRDLLYEGKRRTGYPTQYEILHRARMLADSTGGGMSVEAIASSLHEQYAKLKNAGDYDAIILWFDACLFDQSMLCHILALTEHIPTKQLSLLVIDQHPGIDRFHGLGQLKPEQLAAYIDEKKPVSQEQIQYAIQVDAAFSTQDLHEFHRLAEQSDTPLPWVPAAITRWLEEQPHPHTGLGRLEKMTMDAIRTGHEDPISIFKAVASNETPPQYWGDTTLWNKINGLAEMSPPLVLINGPDSRLPVWKTKTNLKDFKILPLEQEKL